MSTTTASSSGASAPSIMDRCRQFSGPMCTYDSHFAEIIAVTHAKGLVDTFVADPIRSGSPRTDGLRELLIDWSGSATDFTTAWHPAFGALEWALETGQPECAGTAIRLAMHLSACGQPGTWSAEVPDRLPLWWSGQRLPPASQIAVTSDGHCATIWVKGLNGACMSESVELERKSDGHWEPPVGEPPVTIPGSRLALVPHTAVQDQLAIEDEFHSIAAFPTPDASMAAAYEEALAILSRHAPDYLDWVYRILRGVVPCRCDSSRSRSSSWREAPGMVLVSDGPTPLLIAEMLVHEACHQYFYLAGRLGPMTDASDSRMYYSPAVERERPLDKIMMAYHAFGNVLRFYRMILSAEAGGAVAEKAEREFTANIETMRKSLLCNPAITPLGNALISPLMLELRG
jgi:HEXXH motif-containing protein